MKTLTSKKEASNWALRAVQDLSIYTNKSALDDAINHLKWAIQAVYEAKGMSSNEAYQKVKDL